MNRRLVNRSEVHPTNYTQILFLLLVFKTLKPSGLFKDVTNIFTTLYICKPHHFSCNSLLDMMVHNHIMLFFRTLEETEVNKTTDKLSPNIRVGSSESTPNDLNMNLTSKNELCGNSRHY
jgi:hypothetical protein